MNKQACYEFIVIYKTKDGERIVEYNHLISTWLEKTTDAYKKFGKIADEHGWTLIKLIDLQAVNKVCDLIYANRKEAYRRAGGRSVADDLTIFSGLFG